MFAKVKRPAALVLTAILAGLGLSSPQAASANCATGEGTEANRSRVCCVTSIDYRVTAVDTKIPFQGVPVFKNGPGGSMSVAKSYSGTASYQVTVGAESEVGAVLARAKVSVSGSLTLSNSTTATNTYHQDISRGKYGNARYVSWGKEVSYVKTRLNANCTSTKLASGKIKYPSTSEGWTYWETNS